MKNKIGVFDSGIGGLTILVKLQQLLPHEDFIYYSDSLHNPYGNKTQEEILELSCDIMDLFMQENCKLVVIACNTASTIVEELRKKYTVPIVATEPALKEAIDAGSGNIIVMATKQTIESEKFNSLLKKQEEANKVFNSKRKIYLWEAIRLASLIEQNNSEEIDKCLKENLEKFQDKGIKSIVLGCTHYPFIKNKIQKYFKNATIFDSSNGVARRTKEILTQNNELEIDKDGILEIKSSKQEDIAKIENIIKNYKVKDQITC